MLMPEVVVGVLRHGKAAVKDGADLLFLDIEDAIRFAPQIAVIANPAPFHIGIALRLANAGVHLLVEKPVADTFEGVEDLIRVCREKSLTLMTGYNLRFSPSLQKFRALVRQNHVGRALSVRAEIGQYLPSWRPESDYRETVSARSALGGGVLMELSHEIDYLRWIFGDVEWVSAISGRYSSLEIDVEDTAHLILGFTGATGQQPLVASLNMDFIRHDTVRTCTVIGESGTIRWDALCGSVAVFEKGGTEWQIIFQQLPERDDTYIEEWRAFIQSIAATTPPVVSGEDGLSVLRVIHAAKLSAGSGSITQVNPRISL